MIEMVEEWSATIVNVGIELAKMIQKRYQQKQNQQEFEYQSFL